MRTIDLRSDTVTLPTPEMREAMANAQVGDDVYGEDPTVNRLQTLAAERLGKPAAIFVPSGTMGNLASLLAHCGRGDEVIMGDKAHIFQHEQGGLAALGGIMPHTIPNQPDGTLKLEDIEAAIRGDDAHYPRTRWRRWRTVGGSTCTWMARVSLTRPLRLTWMSRGWWRMWIR